MEIYKGYSLFTEKSVDEDQRLIKGYATTPTPDRVQDVVEPMGVVYKTDSIKLHMHHDHKRPVGEVRFGKATAKGIPFEARLPFVKEPGVVQERVDEAWHSIKYGLISAVSIGFKPVADAMELLKSGGVRFIKWEMMELSLTSVPANPEAVISAFKSADVSAIRRALGYSKSIQLIRAQPHKGSVRLIGASS